MIYYLVRVDTSGKQNYIFGSNRLKENIGASHLIAAVTGAWAFEAVTTIPGARHNIVFQEDEYRLNPKAATIERDQLDIEVIYSGGGSFLLLFKERIFAVAFTETLSRRVLEESPGLQVLISPPLEINWEKDILHQKISESIRMLGAKLRGALQSRPLAGLGVTVMCNSTGLPAVGITPAQNGDPGYIASPEIFGKLDALEQANRRLRQSAVSPDLKKWNRARAGEYEFPFDMDKIPSSKKDFNYIAVVHIDGDGLGKQLIELAEAFPKAQHNRQYLGALRQFSDEVNGISQRALQETVDYLATQRDQKQLPIRPLVFGGDDVTFVCDGTLGLTLAIQYLRAFQSVSGGKMTACAGIAIVKTHYPFSRAYDLAEELCGSAKKFKKEYEIKGCCLDWHFAQSGLTGDIEFIRDREYRVAAGSLTMRPVALMAETVVPDGRSWETVEAGIHAFNGPAWENRRNKVKAIRDALRSGPQAVQQFRLQYTENNELLPAIAPNDQTWRETGWREREHREGERPKKGLPKEYCGYFDAIEAADWHLALEGK